MEHKQNIEEANPFALSIGDVMAALLLVFILILMATVLQLRETITATEERVNQAEQYMAKRQALSKALQAEFKDDLKKWGAEIDTVSLSVRFNSPDVLFAKGKYTIKDNFKAILNSFLPRYIHVITLPEFKNDIEEIRIEGHSSHKWRAGASENESYFGNMELSQARTRSVLAYLFQFQLYQQADLTDHENNSLKQWCRKKTTANGLSFSKPVLIDGQEDASRSRRVEFRVKIDADKELMKMLEASGES
ncbi:MAG: OmpA family protein [Marinilabiliaceae bacterium]|nr:OmpA family protein [Marinilabiliaceae bacterium]